jgi:protein SCO1/2
MINIRHATAGAPRRKCSRMSRSLAVLILSGVGILAAISSLASTTNYVVHGVVQGIKADEHQLVIAHEEIPNFMDAMTMPFRVKDADILTHVTVGARISFQLHVNENESWVDDVKTLDISSPGASNPSVPSQGALTNAKSNSTASAGSQLRNYKFTNERGQPVSISDFRGQAIALTFIFTRCPIAEYCPRLSRNFQEVQRQLKGMENAPTNWHLLSVTFDPEHDTPEVLKAYAEAYHYDPAHWTFLTGPTNKITELARSCDLEFTPDGTIFTHNFRTLIIDSSNHLQMIFPVGGNISDAIVRELLKATGARSDGRTEDR